MAYKKFSVVFAALFMTQMLFQAEAAWTVLPGSLTWISVGDNGDTWGVDGSARVWRVQTGGWVQQPGSLRQISVGLSGVWGVNGLNDIWRWDNTRRVWNQMPGKAIRVSSGKSVWAIDPAGSLYIFSYPGQWVLQPGKLVEISVSDAGDVWGVNSLKEIYRLGSSGWARSPGALVRIAVGSAGVWGIDASKSVYQFTQGAWVLRDGSLLQIDSGNTVMGINSNNQVVRRV